MGVYKNKNIGLSGGYKSKQNNFKKNKIQKLYQHKMLSELVDIMTPIPINNNIPLYKFEKFEKLKTDLNTVKDKLDEYFKCAEKCENYDKVRRHRDLYKQLRYKVMKDFDAQIVTNAWLKCYELIVYFDLIDIDKVGTFSAFCNAELPGAFICAINHYIKTTRPKITNFDWRGSSIVLMPENEDDKNTKNYLGDTYGLWEKNKSNWMMTVEKDFTGKNKSDVKPGNPGYDNNGDVTVLNNQLDLECRIPNFADLYTHDLGIDVSNNFNTQEAQNTHAHMGAAISALLTLKKGGNFIAKQYTFFEPITINLIIIYASVFEEFYICKPLTSRPGNSEIYLVGVKFLSLPKNYRTILLERLNNFNMNPLIKKEDIPEDVLDSIFNICRVIFKQQIHFINENVKMYNTYKDDPRKLGNGLEFLRKQLENDWIENNKIKPIRPIDLLSSIKNKLG